jgi:predicted DNA binding protein
VSEDQGFVLPDEFLEEVVKDTQINDLQLREQCRTVVNKTQRYIEELYKQKRKLRQVEAYAKRVKGELYQYYKTDYEIKLTTSSDIMIFVERDKKYQTAMKHLNDLNDIVEFLDRTIKNMTNKTWVLQKMVELEKINL